MNPQQPRQPEFGQHRPAHPFLGPPQPAHNPGLSFLGYTGGTLIAIVVVLVVAVILGCVGCCLLGGVGAALGPSPAVTQ